MKEKKEYYTKQELELANNADVINFLQSINYELKKEGIFYRGVVHSSLIIRNNGQWAWNSKDLKGSAPVELLKQILMEDYDYDEKSAYIMAIKRLAGTEGQYLKRDNYNNYTYSNNFTDRNNYTSSNNYKSNNNYKINNNYKPKITDEIAENTNKGNIILPPKNDKCLRTIAYLCNARGLDFEFVKNLILQKKIYETKNYNNVCFVSYDKENNAKHGFIRGTLSDKNFKMDIPNSDKSFAFVLNGNKNAKKVFCFESSIDAISHATLYKLADMDYKESHRISLHGTSFLGLERFLKENLQIEEVVSCLDNDKTGILRSKKMCEEFYKQGYKTFIQPPKEKDYNEELLQFLQNKRELDFEDCYELD